MRKGKITEWNDEKGFGFISPIEDGRKIFFHVSDYPRNRGRPALGQVVFFDPVRSEKGEKATNIALSMVGAPIKSKDRMARASYLVGLFIIFMLAAIAVGRIHFYVFVVYISVSLITFFAYGWDKTKARKGQWRTPEQTLHILALAGGWPGALVAQQYYRHKSQKKEFRIVFWVTVLLNCCTLLVIEYNGVR